MPRFLNQFIQRCGDGRIAVAGIAAWLAVDRSTSDNGGLELCPGTHKMKIGCPEPADAGQSFTNDCVALPAGHEPVQLELAPGDIPFFTGSVVHGSQPNRTRDGWRRSFISHCLPAAATHIGGGYTPYMFDFDDNPVTRESNEWGGPCGVEDDRVVGTFH